MPPSQTQNKLEQLQHPPKKKEKRKTKLMLKVNAKKIYNYKIEEYCWIPKH